MFRPRHVAITAGVVCTGIFALNQMSDLKTPGIKNIENRHSAAGGGHSHVPAAASPMGKEDQPEGRQKEEAGMAYTASLIRSFRQHVLGSTICTGSLNPSIILFRC